MLLPFILSLSEFALWQSVVLCLCDVHERTWNSDISWSGYLDAKYYLHEFQMLWIFFFISWAKCACVIGLGFCPLCIAL